MWIWIGAARTSTLHFVGRDDEAGGLVFALTNRSRAVADYGCQIEILEKGLWTERPLSPGVLWQQPPYRQHLGINPGEGVHVCLNHLPWRGQWRLRVTLFPKRTRFEEKRYLWARQLQMKHPTIAGWLNPRPPEKQVLYSTVATAE